MLVLVKRDAQETGGIPYVGDHIHESSDKKVEQFLRVSILIGFWPMADKCSVSRYEDSNVSSR
jgi:hypothetical protein